MNSIKCVNCGFVSWSTAEICKKCGAQLSEALEVGPGDPINQNPLRAKRLGILFAVIVLIGLSGGLFAFKFSDPNRPQVFVLKDGSKKSSKAWFHSWVTSDPTVDEIIAKYLKVSGWEANPSALTSFVAKGRFKIKNQPGETIVETLGPVRFPLHLHWESCDGEVEFEGQAPDKIVITQKYDDDSKVLQRGTNGTAGWSRRGWSDKSSKVGPHIRLVYNHPMAELRHEGLADVKRGAEFINYFQLPNNKYPQLYLSGKTMVGDRVAYELTNRTHPDPLHVLYFDVETGMLLKFGSYRPGATYIPVFDGYRLPYYESPDLAETYLEDYREVNGVMLPFLIRQRFRQYWIDTTITDFEGNVSIDPSVFEKPSS